MKKSSIILASLAGLLMLTTACNDEWKDEQFEHYISFKAPLNDNGVSAIYVPYTRHKTNENGEQVALLGSEGMSNYLLPIIVSGTTDNPSDITINISRSDTLSILNYEQYQNRTDLYYHELPDQYVSFKPTHTIKNGENVSLYQLDFNFKGIDMSERWVLPLEIREGNGYTAHPRKHYAKALLRVYPFNDFSGTYSATTQKMADISDPNNATGGETSRAYVVDENTVFFYAGNDIDERRTDRALYKIYAKFTPSPEDEKQGTVDFYDPTDNADLGFVTGGQAVYTITERMDDVLPYLMYRDVIISGIDYQFNDYTLDAAKPRQYIVQGSMTMERKINTQMSDEDMAIEW